MGHTSQELGLFSIPVTITAAALASNHSAVGIGVVLAARRGMFGMHTRVSPKMGSMVQTVPCLRLVG